jgi:hypothetical protein
VVRGRIERSMRFHPPRVTDSMLVKLASGKFAPEFWA